MTDVYVPRNIFTVRPHALALQPSTKGCSVFVAHCVRL